MKTNPVAASAITIRQSESAADFAAARELFQEYQAWVQVDLCFQGFAAELASLPGDYAPPRGRLLLAERRRDSAALRAPAASGVQAAPGAPALPEVAGCVCLRALDDDRCEMKRLFVRSGHHGHGIGRRLVETLLDEARAIGYRAMLLDTLPQMPEAQRLYESLGFRDIPPYYDNRIPGARYLRLDLTAG